MNTTLILFTIVLSIFNVKPGEKVNLPEPDKTKGIPLMQALDNRCSSRDFSEQTLSEQQISELLWACWGINRDNGKHTAPSSRNKQEMEVYIALENGLYQYLPEEHSLLCILSEDIRKVTGKQNFVGKAAANIILVANYEKAGSDKETYHTTSACNAGFMSQNMYLYCSSEGLGTVVRAWFDAQKLHNAMKLGEQQEVILCQTVGHIKTR